ncbi:Acyl-CoA dehydrogenase, N-terminal domain [Sphingomonas laterariae]|uniref:Acyl-CoA dehydrogenase, N-terminal domain n=1 Tax=Edaphosphingomonas laterariae TaxID=861865 RepID=A0A239DFM4_9SPHN|nr:acyl-CoA dehydrogenase family protein [Sphingomonas laterariae]SNS30872.1 Acyl-CoA dehydrogenase, N-terminal domain [Sphingomonas laterariae]
MTREELADPFHRLLEGACPPAVVRAIESGGDWGDLWAEIEASGYLDALVPEASGGAGLTLAEIAPLLMALGRHAVPLPVADTMIARALIARTGGERPDGPIVLVAGAASAPVAFAAVAVHALIEQGGVLRLIRLNDCARAPSGDPGSLAELVGWPEAPGATGWPASGVDLAALIAIARAAAMAGAGDRLLEMTVAYANERIQFGKPIGKQQALQQQLAVMAEQVVAMRMAAEIGCAAGLEGNAAGAAVAKRIASAAAVIVADTAHAVHGAIGISEEYDLQLYTRRLRQWRLAGGGETYWAQRLGRLRLAAASLTSVDFVRTHITATGTA